MRSLGKSVWFPAMAILMTLIVAAGGARADAAVGGARQPASGLYARVKAFWAARVAGDLLTQYQYEKAKLGGKISLQQYVGHGGAIFYQQASVLDIQLKNKHTANAIVAIQGRVTGLPMVYKSVIEDRWVQVHGVWYHAPPPAKL